MQFGKQSFNFVDGVEQQKNIVCAATMFNSSPIFSLIKIKISADGKNCEIVGRSSDKREQCGMFAKFVISNVLELIAIK